VQKKDSKDVRATYFYNKNLNNHDKRNATHLIFAQEFVVRDLE